MHRFAVALLVGVVGLAGCAAQEDEMRREEPDPIALGAADGHELLGVDLDRVQVGNTAPDFSLVSLAGPPVTLSSFRGEKNVILVFYRGHW
jgi:cytochrome oxidase Cu insertion factor (SCO1/SenC/PrrC family)